MYWKSSAEYKETDRMGGIYEGTHVRYGKYKATAWARREWALLQFKFISRRFHKELQIGKKSTQLTPGKWMRP